MGRDKGWGNPLNIYLILNSLPIFERQKEDKSGAYDTDNETQDQDDIMDEESVERPNQSPKRSNTKTQHRDIFGRFVLIYFIGLRKISYRHDYAHDNSNYLEDIHHKFFAHLVW